MKYVAILLAIVFITSPSRAAENQPLELRIASVYSLIGVGEEYLQDQLHVVVTNRSNAEVRIYDQWNSWGYNNLTFTAEFPDGKKLELKRFGGRFWAGNGPCEITLKPGEQYTYTVWLKPEDKQDRANSWGPIRIPNGEFPDVMFTAHHPGGRYRDESATGAIDSAPKKIRLQDEWNPIRQADSENAK